MSESDLAALQRPIVKRHIAHKSAQGRRAAQRPRSPSETAECHTFIAWTKLVSFDGAPLFERVVKIANERGKAGIATAILTAIGMRKGFPDYLLLVPSGCFHGLFVEAKRVRDGVIDPEQQDWRDKLDRWGYGASICEGAESMIRAVKLYMRVSGATAAGRFSDRTRLSA